uniref:Uncharacterized protein n=1 Tax=Leersia perrieri TaxID=77586 RepID=A0A0D9XQR0_9ORYZ
MRTWKRILKNRMDLNSRSNFSNSTSDNICRCQSCIKNCLFTCQFGVFRIINNKNVITASGITEIVAAIY